MPLVFIGDKEMGKSLLLASNTNTQTLTNGGIVNFGTIVRRYGCNLNMSGGNLVAKGEGYYPVFVNVSFTGTAGTAIVQIYKDGVAIPGAEASVTTVADTSYQVCIPTTIRQSCCVESTITVVISGVTPTVSNASILSVKE